MSDKITVALIQEQLPADEKTALDQSIANIRKAAAAGAELVVLQELHCGPYFCQEEQTTEFDRAEIIPGPATAKLSALAKELQIVLVASLFEKRAPGIYHNTAVVFEKDGTIAGKYRKMHIPDDPGFYEKFYFTPGDLGFNPIQTSVGNLGVLVCWDQWFPEAARLMALGGADVLIYPTAIGWVPNEVEAEKQRQLTAWMTVQRGHAIANGLPLISCNRVGLEQSSTGSIQFWGNSFIAGPQGELLKHADEKPTILIGEIDKKRSEAVRRIWPFLRDRRIDDYGDLLKRYKI